VTHADDAKEVRLARQNLPCLQAFFCVAKKVAQGLGQRHLLL